MEQNGKNRKPNNNRPHYKKNNADKRDGVKKTYSGDKAQKAEKKATQSFGDSYAESKTRKKKTISYSGSFDLVDSFEAEEQKKGYTSEKSYKENGKASAKRKNVDSSKKSKSSERNKKDFDREEPSFFDDDRIHTVPQNKYIPFETYDDDDIIPDVADAYESFDRSENYGSKNGKGVKKGKKGKGSNNSYRRDEENDGRDGGIPGAVVGRNAVRELLRSDRSVDKLYVKSGAREGSIVVIVAEAVSKKIPIVEVSDSKLDSMAGGSHHQGVVALAAEKQYTDIESILQIAKDRGETPLIVIADGIEDPQNLGAVIRCAECAGVHGIIIPKRRAVGLTPIVTKASAGAIEHMAIAKVSNLADAVEKLKKAGLWIFAAEAGGTPYYEADFKVPAAIVLGSEGFGVSRLIKERSDFTVSIPMYGKVNSLNVSTAASVILCHAARMQRS